MSAYIVIRIKVEDPKLLIPYQKIAPVVIEKYKGKLLVRGGEVASLEGPDENRRIVIIEFPNFNLAKDFYHSKEYSRAIELRKDIADFKMIAIDGIS